MLADSATELFAASAALYDVARPIDAGEERKVLHARASMIKLLCSETAGRIADRAVQVGRPASTGPSLMAYSIRPLTNRER